MYNYLFAGIYNQKIIITEPTKIVKCTIKKRKNWQQEKNLGFNRSRKKLKFFNKNCLFLKMAIVNQ